MHILIDTTNGRALARHESYKALSALHYIQFANVDGAIIRTGENRVYAQFTHATLENVLRNTGAAEVPTEYRQLIRTVRAVLEEAPYLLLPFTREQLEAQAHALAPNDDRPMAFDPGSDRPKLLRSWCSEPQLGRKRADSSFWIDFASGPPEGYSNASALPAQSADVTVRKRNTPPIPSTEEQDMAAKKPAKKAAKKTSAKKVAKKSAPAKKAATKKAPAKRATTGDQEERNGVKRPRPGGNTAAVWDACDALMKKKGSAPSFKELDEYLGNKDIPTATRRSNYAVWRKFNGISGRVG